MRPGTENVPAIVGFGAAAELARSRRESDLSKTAALRNGFEQALCERVSCARVIGALDSRICNTTNIAFEGLEAEAILIGLSERGLCASSGSACSSGSLEPSHVLQAMGIPDPLTRGAVRFSLSRDTTESEIDRAKEVVSEVVNKLAAFSA